MFTKLASHRQHGWNLRTLLVCKLVTNSQTHHQSSPQRHALPKFSPPSCTVTGAGLIALLEAPPVGFGSPARREKTATQSPVIGNKSSLTLDIHQCGNVFGEKTTVSRGTDAEVLRFVVQTFEASVKGSPVAAAFALSFSSELLFLHPAVALLILLDTSSRFTEYLLAVGLAVHIMMLNRGAADVHHAENEDKDDKDDGEEEEEGEEGKRERERKEAGLEYA
eukprot:758653-Hanusia_phi.AAC.1